MTVTVVQTGTLTASIGVENNLGALATGVYTLHLDLAGLIVTGGVADVVRIRTYAAVVSGGVDRLVSPTPTDVPAGTSATHFQSLAFVVPYTGSFSVTLQVSGSSVRSIPYAVSKIG